MKKLYLIIVPVVILLIAAISVYIYIEDIRDVGYGPCYSFCSDIIYDSNLIVETKTDARIVFDQYLKQYGNISFVYDVREEKTWKSVYSSLNISGSYYPIYFKYINCLEFANKTRGQLENNTEWKNTLRRLCGRVAVTSNGKICSVASGPC